MSLLSIYRKLREEGMSDAGAKAAIGNMDAESALRPDNLQDSYEKMWGITDAEYCRRVNSGECSKETFATDSAGFGLYQLTYAPRKRSYYTVAVEQWGVPIEDEECQVWHMCYEMRTDFPSLWEYLCSGMCDMNTASDRICTEFERPAVNNLSYRRKCAASRAEEIDELITAKQESQSTQIHAEAMAINYEVLFTRLEEFAYECLKLAELFRANKEGLEMTVGKLQANKKTLENQGSTPFSACPEKEKTN